jgi:hypothetical protein
MDRSKHRAAEPIAATSDIQASRPSDNDRALEVGEARRAPERGSGVLRELAELTCHWD